MRTSVIGIVLTEARVCEREGDSEVRSRGAGKDVEISAKFCHPFSQRQRRAVERVQGRQIVRTNKRESFAVVQDLYRHAIILRFQYDLDRRRAGVPRRVEDRLLHDQIDLLVQFARHPFERWRHVQGHVDVPLPFDPLSERLEPLVEPNVRQDLGFAGERPQAPDQRSDVHLGLLELSLNLVEPRAGRLGVGIKHPRRHSELFSLTMIRRT